MKQVADRGAVVKRKIRRFCYVQTFDVAEESIQR